MSSPTDDLASLFAQQPSRQLRIVQGVLRFWNAESRENVVEYRGALLQDLPVLDPPDGSEWTEGMNVQILASGGSYLVLGRVRSPGAQTASGG